MLSSDFSLLSSALVDPGPWLEPYLSVARRVFADAQSSSVVESLNRRRAGSLPDFQFVPHASLPTDEAYEAFIARTRCIPTRENLHDFFNGVVWLTFPQTKRRLNQLQAAEIARQGVSDRRGPIRDALTLFDENGAILCAPSTLIEALRCRNWSSLFVTHREAWHSAQLVIFGHALLEKLLQPRKAITAHVWLVDALTDGAIAASVTHERLAAKTFLPMPVLGVPQWWNENRDPRFYDDTTVFRVAR